MPPVLPPEKKPTTPRDVKIVVMPQDVISPLKIEPNDKLPWQKDQDILRSK
jgi:hypothetical protein